MLQERPDGDAGGENLRRVQEHGYYNLLCVAILSESIREAKRKVGEKDAGVRLLKCGEKVFVTVVPD